MAYALVTVWQGKHTALYRVNWRAQERNKYAPWGRGEYGGAEVRKDGYVTQLKKKLLRSDK